MFNIDKYLKNKHKVNNTFYGTCRICSEKIPWARRELSSHKRSGNCAGQSEKEKDLFKKSKIINEIDTSSFGESESSLKSRKGTLGGRSWVDLIDEGQRDAVDKSLSKLFYRCNLSFSIVESPAFKEFIDTLRPSYTHYIPNRKTLGSKMLENAYEEYKEIGESMLKNAQMYSLVSDGWSNERSEHLVNFIVVIPNQKPFFLKTIDTSGVIQSGENIAKEIIEVANEIGADKLISVVTDNAPCMQSAWRIIEQTFPHVFANGCSAHGLNLFIRDVCSHETFKTLLDDTVSAVEFIKGKDHLRYKFKQLQQNFGKNNSLKLPVETRWYTQFNTVNSFLQNRLVVLTLLEEEEFQNLENSDSKRKFKNTVTDNDYWSSKLKFLCKVLEFPSYLIGKMENDSNDLSKVYEAFQRLMEYYDTMEEDVDFIKDLLLHRWNFMHTESMGMAYILNPANIGNRMVGGDYRDSVVHLKTHIDRIYSEPEEAEKCKAEFVEFISFFRLCSEAEKDALVGSKAKEYWAVYGCNDYPLLGKIAIQLYHVPTSSASSERVWSIFGFVHSLKRNRLKNEKVERLEFIYCNAALLDAVDNLDYLKFNNFEDLDDSDDSTEGEEVVVIS